MIVHLPASTVPVVPVCRERLGDGSSGRLLASSTGHRGVDGCYVPTAAIIQRVPGPIIGALAGICAVPASQGPSQTNTRGTDYRTVWSRIADPPPAEAVLSVERGLMASWWRGERFGEYDNRGRALLNQVSQSRTG